MSATVKFLVISRKEVLKLNVHGFTIWQLDLIWYKRNLKKLKSVRTQMESLTRILLVLLHFQWNVHAKLMLSSNTGHILSLLLSYKQNLWKCDFIQLAITACLFSSKFQSNWPQHSWIKWNKKIGSFYEIFAKTDNNLRIFRAGYEGNFDPDNH